MKSKAIALVVLALLAVSMAFSIGHTTAALIGDLDGDGKVDIADLTAAAAHFGQPDPGVVPPLVASPDVNNDGIVDILDLIIIATHWTG